MKTKIRRRRQIRNIDETTSAAQLVGAFKETPQDQK
jgi:hypothetical protein